MHRAIKSHADLLLVTLLGVALVLVLFWPVLADLDGRIMGPLYSEQRVSAYLNQAFAEDMVVHHRLPMFVTDMVYAEGVVTPLSLTTALQSLFFYPFWGAVGTFNLAMMLNLVLALLGAYLLFRRVGGSRLAAVPAALLYALAPYTLDNFVFGPIECAALGWTPLALLAVERVDGTWRRNLVAGVALALTFAASPYYSVFTVFGAVFLMLSRRGLALGARCKRVVATFAIAGVLTAPMAFAVHHSLVHPRSLTPTRTQPQDPAFHQEFLAQHVSVDLASLVLPTRAYQTKLRHHGAYLGLAGLVACGFALFWVRRSRRWLCLGAGALLFAIGGGIKIGGHMVSLGGYSLAPPAWWLCNYVPPFTQVYTPFRALPLVYLAMGAALALLLSRRGVGAGRLQVALISLALAAELLVGFRGGVTLPWSEHAVHPVYRKLGAARGPGGVVDLPAPATDNELGSYLLAQLTHRRRVPYNLDMDGFGGAVTPEMYDLVLRLGMDAHVPNHPPDLELDMHRFRCKGGCGGVEHLRQRGYRFLVLHRTGHSALDGRFRRCLERCVPAPIFADDDVRAYELPAAGGAGAAAPRD